MLSRITYLLLLALACAHAASRIKLQAEEDYLNRVYQRAKDRQLRNGELNLLPDESDGFANTVRCLPEVAEGFTGRTTGTTRNMRFQTAMLKPSEQVISTKLVISLPATFSEDGEVTLYKFSDGSEHFQLLDKAQVPTYGTTSWFELTVGTTSVMEGTGLQIELTHSNFNFLENLQPMLVLYTYVEQSLPNLIGKRSATDTISVDEDQSNVEEQSNVPLSELDEQNVACSKQSVSLEYSQLNYWLGEDVTIIAPPTPINFDFCYGHCLSPLEVPLHADDGLDYDKRARILEVMNQMMYHPHRLTPPPCCIPLSYIASKMLYTQDDIVMLTSFPMVERCGCKA